MVSAEVQKALGGKSLMQHVDDLRAGVTTSLPDVPGYFWYRANEVAAKTKSATGLRLVKKPGFEHLPNLSVKNLSAGGKIEQEAQRLSAGRAVMERNYLAYRASLSDTERAKVPELLEKYDLHHLITDANARMSPDMREWLMRGGDIDAGFNLRAMPNKSAKVWLQNVLGHASEGNPDPHRHWDHDVKIDLEELRQSYADATIMSENLSDRRLLPDKVLNNDIEHIMRKRNLIINDRNLPKDRYENILWQDELGQTHIREVVKSALPPLALLGSGRLLENEIEDEKD